jgi:hypothetical protein
VAEVVVVRLEALLGLRLGEIMEEAAGEAEEPVVEVGVEQVVVGIGVGEVGGWGVEVQVGI